MAMLNARDDSTRRIPEGCPKDTRRIPEGYPKEGAGLQWVAAWADSYALPRVVAGSHIRCPTYTYTYTHTHTYTYTYAYAHMHMHMVHHHGRCGAGA